MTELETQVAPETPPGTEAQPPAPDSPATQPEGTEDTFPRAYVEQLRAEAAEHRIKAARADRLAAELMVSTKQTAAGDLLRDVGDLADSAEFVDGDGIPDPEKIRAAAEDLISQKPWLARVRGDVGQGPRGVEPESVSLGSLLREAAR